MGLKADIKSAFLKSMGNPVDDNGQPVEGNVDQLSEDLTNAIIDFLTKQTFTITEMKAILEVEELKTLGSYTADIMPTVMVSAGIPTAGSPVAQSTVAPGLLMGGTKGVLIPKVNFGKLGGQGGAMQSKGHAYIGRNPIDGAETNEDKTKVKLLDENIVER